MIFDLDCDLDLDLSGEHRAVSRYCVNQPALVGCMKQDDHGFSTTLCYCDTDFCNTATNLKKHFHVLLIALSACFIINFYLR